MQTAPREQHSDLSSTTSDEAVRSRQQRKQLKEKRRRDRDKRLADELADAQASAALAKKQKLRADAQARAAAIRHEAERRKEAMRQEAIRRKACQAARREQIHAAAAAAQKEEAEKEEFLQRELRNLAENREKRKASEKAELQEIEGKRVRWEATKIEAERKAEDISRRSELKLETEEELQDPVNDAFAEPVEPVAEEFFPIDEPVAEEQDMYFAEEPVAEEQDSPPNSSTAEQPGTADSDTAGTAGIGATAEKPGTADTAEKPGIAEKLRAFGLTKPSFQSKSWKLGPGSRALPSYMRSTAESSKPFLGTLRSSSSAKVLNFKLNQPSVDKANVKKEDEDPTARSQEVPVWRPTAKKKPSTEPSRPAAKQKPSTKPRQPEGEKPELPEDEKQGDEMPEDEKPSIGQQPTIDKAEDKKDKKDKKKKKDKEEKEKKTKKDKKKKEADKKTYAPGQE